MTTARSALKKSSVTSVIKRDKAVVPFNSEKISKAIFSAAKETGEFDEIEAQKLTLDVLKIVTNRFSKNRIPTVEDVQDIVEMVLITSNWVQTAKAYILYRDERARERAKRRSVPEAVKRLAQDSKKYFRNELAEFVYYRTYSRWKKDEGRRETWIETVQRFMDFMKLNIGDALSESEYAELHDAILNHKIMPSMRLMWSAGEACERTNVTAYNCAYIAPKELGDFSDIMYVLMCGGGVGFSVSHETVHAFPQIKRQTGKKLKTHVVGDSKEGWADALKLGLQAWFEGKDVGFDYSKVRPEGTQLKVMGGRSSGPAPLKSLLEFSRQKILDNQGRRLSTLDVHDIICKIGEIVVMGGVRRSSLISLSDLDDQDMRDAKAGTFYYAHPERNMANNSAIYDEKPTAKDFLEEWIALVKSGSGERGIFNRGDLLKQIPERRKKTFEPGMRDAGLNPCGEIILQSKQFCNLTEVIARPEDTEASLIKKARLAAILGTYQSTLTNFPYLSSGWKENCERERLLGVSITGQWDCPAVHKKGVFGRMKDQIVETNKKYAKKFGVNQSAAATCVKPSGTVSQLVDAASGLHTRYAPYYIRRVRIDRKDPLFFMMKEQGFPYKPEVGHTEESASTFVFEFPIKAPEGAIVQKDLSAIEQLEYWKRVKTEFTEHNPSVTISVGSDEWIGVADWVYDNWEIVGGLSFLPRNDHVYMLAPYEEIDKKTYDEMVKKTPDIDFSEIVAYERDDETQGSKELACTGNKCEL